MFQGYQEVLYKENLQLRNELRNAKAILAILIRRSGNRVSVSIDEIQDMLESNKEIRTYIDENTMGRILEVK